MRLLKLPAQARARNFVLSFTTGRLSGSNAENPADVLGSYSVSNCCLSKTRNFIRAL